MYKLYIGLSTMLLELTGLTWKTDHRSVDSLLALSTRTSIYLHTPECTNWTLDIRFLASKLTTGHLIMLLVVTQQCLLECTSNFTRPNVQIVHWTFDYAARTHWSNMETDHRSVDSLLVLSTRMSI